VIEPRRIEMRMAIAKITAVGDADWTMGVGSIGVIGGMVGCFDAGCCNRIRVVLNSVDNSRMPDISGL
jgi:hypothetical protein